jgi:hypothetical protein
MTMKGLVFDIQLAVPMTAGIRTVFFSRAVRYNVRGAQSDSQKPSPRFLCPGGLIDCKRCAEVAHKRTPHDSFIRERTVCGDCLK